MKVLYLVLILLSHVCLAQVVNSVELSAKLDTTSEEAAKKELQHLAVLKSLEKIAPELGYKFDEFMQKLDQQFSVYFEAYKDRSAQEKFGPQYKTILGETERQAFFETLEKERHNNFIKFSRTLDIIRSSSITAMARDSDSWKAKIELDLDKIKLERLFRKTLSNETKPFSKIILISEIDPFQFVWTDLGLESEKSFLKPLNASWLNWLNENLPSTVEEVSSCDEGCQIFFSKWTDSHIDQISIPPEFVNGLFLRINIALKKIEHDESLEQSTFEWEGRALLQDIKTKRIFGSYVLNMEKRSFKRVDLKALNSGLASSLYRTPMSALKQFNRKIEEKLGFNRVSRLVVKGFRHFGDLHTYIELLKSREPSLGLEIFLDSFTKEEAKLACFYRGEEKSFTDLLSGIKELKSSHSYALVNEITEVHNVIKFVAE